MAPAQDLFTKIEDGSARAAVIGLGYVGLPLAMATARAGFATLGFDIDTDRAERINSGLSDIASAPCEDLRRHISAGLFRATSEAADLSECDVIMICVPTPLTPQRQPDLQYVERTAETIASVLRPGQMIVLESTTYPGTTEEVLQPILEGSGLKSGTDFFLAYSPEREDPGNDSFTTTSIPKIVSGDGEEASRLAEAFYRRVVEKVVTVSSLRTAEAVKITENIFRAVNIGLVNDLKLIYEAMGVDIWEVVDAAATKPFGYMPFYPGPGLGGHCIPVDPFYLTWKAREYGLSARFVELAGEINVAMPAHVVRRTEAEIDRRQSVSLSSAKILVVGLAYKKNVADTRESPALELLALLRERGVEPLYHDPLVAEVPRTRHHPWAEGIKSVPLTAGHIARCNAVLIATDHDAVDYTLIARHARLIIDTRNAFGRRSIVKDTIVKA
ncbi:nucleotide sugar dehydrogenase [Mesorhizobium xinjiangense]|uniref:nucleotide sugar dehydrogenase n=1 Tax=Mesorhizobium xinjiangense TaxID=2678685 RepID=UPI0012EEBBD6|nr:nucleotide sugar dehydrogenase [Mesorhizobium xinjiangense]